MTVLRCEGLMAKADRFFKFQSSFHWQKFLSLSILCFLLIYSPKNHAQGLNADLRGFLALDLFSLQKIEGRRQTAEMGVGFFDIKLYADYEDFHMRVKLDLGNNIQYERNPNRDLSTNFLEELLISWRPKYHSQIMFGKGRVPFHQRRYGVINSSYISGGSMLGTRHSFRDQKRKILLTYRYGAFSKRFFNHLTFFGDSRQPQLDRDFPDQPRLGRDFDEINYRQSDSFNTKNEIGIANRFEYLPFRGMQVAVAGLWHRRNIDPTPTYAFDFSTRYSTRQFQFYAEYVYAFVSTHPNDRFAAEKQYEQIGQIGGEYRFNRDWSFMVNIERAWVNSQSHDRNNFPNFRDCEDDNRDPIPGCFAYGQSRFNDGSKEKIETHKIEMGLKRRWGRSLQITGGVMAEQQKRTFDSERIIRSNAYELGFSLALWY